MDKVFFSNQVAAEEEEEGCGQGEKFANYCKKEDISATTLVTPAKWNPLQTWLASMMVKVPGSDNHCNHHGDSDDSDDDDDDDDDQEPIRIATTTVMTPFRMIVTELNFCTDAW